MQLIIYSLLHHQDLALAQTELLICTNLWEVQICWWGLVCISNYIYKSSVRASLCSVIVSKFSAGSLDLNALLLSFLEY